MKYIEIHNHLYCKHVTKSKDKSVSLDTQCDIWLDLQEWFYMYLK
jgi:hypothetical protein